MLNLTFSEGKPPSQVLHPLSSLAKTLLHLFLSPALLGIVLWCILNLTSVLGIETQRRIGFHTWLWRDWTWNRGRWKKQMQSHVINRIMGKCLKQHKDYILIYARLFLSARRQRWTGNREELWESLLAGRIVEKTGGRRAGQVCGWMGGWVKREILP